jgi:hypothetical protein
VLVTVWLRSAARSHGIAGEDAATIQRNWEPHPERLAIDVAGLQRIALGALLRG